MEKAGSRGAQAQPTGTGALTMGNNAALCLAPSGFVSHPTNTLFWAVLQGEETHLNIAPVSSLKVRTGGMHLNHSCVSPADCSPARGSCPGTGSNIRRMPDGRSYQWNTISELQSSSIWMTTAKNRQASLSHVSILSTCVPVHREAFHSRRVIFSRHNVPRKALARGPGANTSFHFAFKSSTAGTTTEELR